MQSKITLVCCKIVVVHASKGKLSTTCLTDKYKTLKETGLGKSYKTTSRKYGVTKTTVPHWLKNKSKIFEAVEENSISKKKKKE